MFRRAPSLLSRVLPNGLETHAGAAVGAAAGYWLVLDMDGTLVPTPSKAHGHYEPLSASPCFEPFRAWLRNGGSACVVSTAGRRMKRQLYDCVADVLLEPGAGRFVMVPYGGAQLLEARAYSPPSPSEQAEAELLKDIATAVEEPSAEEGEGEGERKAEEQVVVPAAAPASIPPLVGLFEDRAYRSSAVPGGTCLSRRAVRSTTELLEEKFVTLFDHAATDASIIESLSRKYRVPYEALAARRRQCTTPSEFAARHLPRETLLAWGAVLKDPPHSMITVHHVFPSDPWVSDESEEDRPVAQIAMLGVPMARHREFFRGRSQQYLAELGVVMKPQPNSVAFTVPNVDKATVMRWMLDSAKGYNMAPGKVFAIGDAPATVDRPMTLFPDVPFVSVSPSQAEDVACGCKHLVRVGEEEAGTARFLQGLLAALASRSPTSDPPPVDSVEDKKSAGLSFVATVVDDIAVGSE